MSCLLSYALKDWGNDQITIGTCCSLERIYWKVINWTTYQSNIAKVDLDPQ